MDRIKSISKKLSPFNILWLIVDQVKQRNWILMELLSFKLQAINFFYTRLHFSSPSSQSSKPKQKRNITIYIMLTLCVSSVKRFQPNINCHLPTLIQFFTSSFCCCCTIYTRFTRVLTKMASFIMLIVVKRTKIEKINVHIGSKIFHSGWKYITRAVRKTPHDCTKSLTTCTNAARTVWRKRV